MNNLPALTKQQDDAFNAYDLSGNHIKVFHFYRNRFNGIHPKQDGTRNDLQAVTGMATQTASGRTSDLEAIGILYKNGQRREGQACLQFEPDPKRWGYHATNYRNGRRNSRCIGMINEFGSEMPAELRKGLLEFGQQTRIGL